MISILSKYQICFSTKAENEVKKLFRGISYLKSNTFLFGNPVFAGMDIDSIKKQIDENYDIVLLHPQSLSREQTKNDLINIKKKLKKSNLIRIYQISIHFVSTISKKIIMIMFVYLEIEENFLL